MSTLSKARGVKRALARTGLLAPLRALGVPRLARRLYDQGVIRRGRMTLRVLDQELAFVAQSRREVHRLEDLSFEEEVIGRIAESLQPGDVFYDVGANIGVVSVAVGAARREAGVTIHAFEPEARNADHLRRNLDLNRLDDAAVHRLALGAESGTIRLYVTGEAGEGTHSIVARDGESRDAVEIPIDAGSNFAAAHGGPPDVIKIDVEGAEFDVLRGFGPDFDRGAIRTVFIEAHPKHLDRLGESPESIQAWLETRGYELVWSRPRWTEVHQQFERRERETTPPDEAAS